MKKFIRSVGFYPYELIADRDFKLIGTHMDDILEPFTQVSGAPSGRQNQNGLSESNWRYICDIARNYLVEHLLPSEYWFFAIQYAVQVSNYIPIKTTSNILTTPHFLAYNEKPDYRKLIPLFSMAYVKIYQSGEGNNLESQTVKAILVGNDPKSDGRLFYNPHTKNFMSSSDYILNVSSPSGPIFNLNYEEPTSYNLYTESSVSTDKPAFDLSQVVYLSPSHTSQPLQKATVIDIPFKHNDPYTLQLATDSSIISVQPCHILPYNPSSDKLSDTSPSISYPWLKDKAKATLFLSNTMSQPKHGIIVRDGPQWLFHQGHSLRTKSKNRKKKVVITLPSAITDLEHLMDSKRLVSGWINSKTVLHNIETAKTFNFIARRVTFMKSTNPENLKSESVRNKIKATQSHDLIGFTKKVSAANLSSLYEPKLHEHHKLPTADKEIWDASYLEEYMGLHEDTKTWEYISEKEYQTLRPIVGNALPTMAISKIKTDENGKPVRAKYRIVVLGNLDPHEWSSKDCFAPVISSLELRILVSLCAQLKCTPKSGDVSQAFV